MNLKRALIFSLTATSLLLSSLPSTAAWLYESNESAFDESDTVHMAVTVGMYGGFGVRCQAEEMKAVYILADANFDRDTIERSNRMKAMKLKLRVDKDEILTLDALGSLGDGGSFVLTSNVTRSQVEQFRQAKKNIAVAVAILGKNYYEDKLSVAGSTSAVGSVIKHCFAESDN